MRKIFHFFYRIAPIAIVLYSCSTPKVSKTASISKKAKSDYEVKWKELDSLEKIGLNKQAIEQSNLILQKAFKDENTSEIFKALAYRSKNILWIEESAEEKVLSDFEENVQKSNPPTKQLLQSALAELYYQYYLQNQWKINQRTYSENDKEINTWDKHKIEELIKTHYLNSLKINEPFKSKSIQEFETILQGNQEKIDHKLRPTFYDFLCYRALNYFQSNGSTIPVALDIKASKSEALIDKSNEEIVSSIYGSLLEFHTKNKTPWGYVHAKLNELNYLKSRSFNFTYRDSLYSLIHEVKEEKLKNEVRIELLNSYYAQGNDMLYSSQNDSSRLAYQKANKILERLENYDKTPFQDSVIKAFKTNIHKAEFRIFLKNTYLLEYPIEIKAEFRNLNEIEFYVFSSDNEFEKLSRRGNRSSVLNWIEKQKIIKTISIKLPKHDDFNFHSAEFPLFKLAFGDYILLAKDKSELAESDFYLAEFTVSNLAIFTHDKNEKGLTFYVKNRENGMAIENAKIKLKENYRNQPISNSINTFGGLTDKNGLAVFPDLKTNSSYTYSVTYGEDNIDFKKRYLYYSSPRIKEDKTQTIFFTDRAIYKEDQRVYFKAIQSIQSNRKSSLISNAKNQVFLIDPNGKYLDTLSLVTSNFGSFYGSFKLPQQSLNGYYRIASKSGQTYFQLTDYKRPSFQILLKDTLENIGSSVQLNGTVKAYSGEAEQNATINYKVFFSNSIPRPYYIDSYFPFNSEKILLSDGKTSTNSKGEYQLEFETSAVAKNSFYNYTIEIIATNQRGESLEKTFQINPNRKSKVSLSIDESLSKDEAIEWEELEQLVVKSEDQNGREQDKKLKLQLWKLKPLEEIDFTKTWSPGEYYFKVDSFIERQSSIESFYKKVQLISESVIKTNEVLSLFQPLDEGVYQVVLRDPSDTVFNLERSFYLLDRTKKAFDKASFLWTSELKTDLTKYPEVEIFLGSSLDKAIINYDIDYRGEIIESGKIEVSNSKEIFSYSPTIAIDNDFRIHFYLVHSNHLERKTIEVKSAKQDELQIQLNSFRDKTKPGEREKLALQVIKNGKAVEAEVLASMYDASLDQFVNHRWNFHPIDRYYIPQIRNSDASFFDSYPNPFYISGKRPIPSYGFYDLNWFKLRFQSYLLYDERTLLISEQKSSSTAEVMTDAVEIEGSAIANTKMEEEIKEVKTFPLRTDFRETAFFYPNLKTNRKGEVQFEFEVPESLTEWKLMILAHTKTLDNTYLEKRVISQKELMVKVNAPKFLRSGDKAVIKAELINLTNKDLSVTSDFSIFNSDNKELSNNRKKGLNISANSSETIYLSFLVPSGVSYLEYQASASSKTHQDGEKNQIVVIPREEVVTKSFPFSISEGENKTWIFEEFQNDIKNSLNQHTPLNYTFEYSSTQWNRIIESLNSIILQNATNTVQIAEKLIAIDLFQFCLKKKPNLRGSIENSKSRVSVLESNPELKSILINQTPWALIAASSTIQNQHLKKLLIPSYLDSIKKESENKLLALQFSDGSWPWFEGMKKSRFISESILNLFAQTAKFEEIELSAKLKKSLSKTIHYLDKEMEEEYRKLLQDSSAINTATIRDSHLAYLHARSYFEKDLKSDFFSFYLTKALSNWQGLNISHKAKLGQLLINTGLEEETISLIYSSIKDAIILDSEKGAYWKTNKTYFTGFDDEVKQHCIAMCFISKVVPNDPILNDLKKWLYFQKKNASWGETNSTTLNAISILIQYIEDTKTDSYSRISLSDRLDTTLYKEEYLKVNWSNEDISEDLAYIKLSSNKKEVSFGAAYWQSLQEPDFEESQNSQIILERAFYKAISKNGIIQLIPIDSSALAIGDKLIVRVKLIVNTTQSYVHLKVENAAASLPVDMLSGNYFQDNLSFYKEVELSRTNYFFNEIGKGTYILETAYLINQSGEYGSGKCSVQSQYSADIISTVPSKLLIIKEN